MFLFLMCPIPYSRTDVCFLMVETVAGLFCEFTQLTNSQKSFLALCHSVKSARVSKSQTLDFTGFYRVKKQFGTLALCFLRKMPECQNHFCDSTQSHKVTESQSRKTAYLQGFTEEKTGL